MVVDRLLGQKIENIVTGGRGYSKDHILIKGILKRGPDIEELEKLKDPTVILPFVLGAKNHNEGKLDENGQKRFAAVYGKFVYETYKSELQTSEDNAITNLCWGLIDSANLTPDENQKKDLMDFGYSNLWDRTLLDHKKNYLVNTILNCDKLSPVLDKA